MLTKREAWKKLGLLCLVLILAMFVVACNLEQKDMATAGEKVLFSTNTGPIAECCSHCRTVQLGGLVFFGGEKSYTAVEWVSIDSALWDFGDGTTEEGPWSQTKFVSHIYTEPYFYTVSLTVTDSDGKKASASCTILAHDGGAMLTTGPWYLRDPATAARRLWMIENWPDIQKKERSWGPFYWIFRWGGFEEIEITCYNPQKIKAYYFESADITLMVDIPKWKIVTWEFGKTNFIPKEENKGG